MTLADLMKIENIDDYYIWWYGASMPADYFCESGFCKEWLTVYKGVDTEYRRIFIALHGISAFRSKYLFAIRLTGKNEEGLYSWEKVPLSLDQYAGRLYFKSSTKFSFYNSKACAENFVVDHIRALDENRTVDRFRDYESVEFTFNQLKEVVENEYADYYAALSCVKAVYMIIDGNTGKQYVGSAYSNEGLWGRWCTYAYTCHGNNQQLMNLYEEHGEKYFTKFKYIILRIFPMSMTDMEVINAESQFKERFMTREFGLNSN